MYVRWEAFYHLLWTLKISYTVNVSGCPQRIMTGLGQEKIMEGPTERARGFVHVNVHAYSHPHLNKSGQPFRHPVPWLVHYAEAILTCKNSLSVQWSIFAFQQTVLVRQTYSHSLPSRVRLYTCWIIKQANLRNHESFKIWRPPFCIFLWKQQLHFIQNERKPQEGKEEMRSIKNGFL